MCVCSILSRALFRSMVIIFHFLSEKLESGTDNCYVLPNLSALSRDPSNTPGNLGAYGKPAVGTFMVWTIMT